MGPGHPQSGTTCGVRGDDDTIVDEISQPVDRCVDIDLDDVLPPEDAPAERWTRPREMDVITEHDAPGPDLPLSLRPGHRHHLPGTADRGGAGSYYSPGSGHRSRQRVTVGLLIDHELAVQAEYWSGVERKIDCVTEVGGEAPLTQLGGLTLQPRAPVSVAGDDVGRATVRRDLELSGPPSDQLRGCPDLLKMSPQRPGWLELSQVLVSHTLQQGDLPQAIVDTGRLMHLD